MINPYVLGQKLAESFLLAENQKKRVIAIYSGRFQPFHSGHRAVYDYLANKFGKNNVYIGTSDVVSYPKSPFSFNQKKHIITKMFGISPEHIVHVKSPYNPEEILRKFDPDSTSYVTAYSEKDAGRLEKAGGKYFQQFDPKKPLEGYKERGYFITVPEFHQDVGGGNVSGTQVRAVFSDPNSSNEIKKHLFTKLYGKFDQDVFDLIVDKTKEAAEHQEKTSVDIEKARIENPETKRKILVKTALSYEKEHPAHQAAEKLLHKENTMISRACFLKEGGAAGHMSHPFEDMNLTFGDLKNIIELGLEGHLDIEAPVTEKLDGQNISVSYIPERGVIFARNKTQMSNFGINAMDVNGVKQQFAGRGAVSDAFNYAAEDLETAILELTEKQRKAVFADGHKFMSIEVIYPATQNVIPYGLNMLVAHNSFDVDEKGNTSGVNKEAARMLAGMIKKINANTQKTFAFRGPVVVSLPKAKDFDTAKSRFLSRVNKLQSEFGLSDNDPVMQYHQMWWDQYLTNAASRFKYAMPNTVKDGLIRRWAFGDLSFTKEELEKLPKGKFREWALAFDKSDKDKQAKENIRPFEMIFLQLGAEILSNASGLLSAIPGAEQIRAEVGKVSKELENSKDITKLSKLRKELERLQEIGLDKISSSEGIVFMYHGKVYKLTGSFAATNQIIGLLKYAR